MGKNKSSKFFQGKEAFQRMNFLFQASEFLMSRVHQPTLAAYYGSQMTSICKKSVLRMEPRVKRQLCKGCKAPLVPGVSSRLRTNSSSKNVVITCLQCGTVRRQPMKSGYRVWVETPEACVETLSTDTANKTESTKPERTQNQHKGPKEEKQKSAQLPSTEAAENDSRTEHSHSRDAQCDEDHCKPQTETEVFGSNKVGAMK